MLFSVPVSSTQPPELTSTEEQALILGLDQASLPNLPQPHSLFCSGEVPCSSSFGNLVRQRKTEAVTLPHHLLSWMKHLCPAAMPKRPLVGVGS